MRRRGFGVVVLILAVSMLGTLGTPRLGAEPSLEKSGGATPEEAFRILQATAAERNISGMAAVLAPRDRGWFLGTLAFLAAGYAPRPEERASAGGDTPEFELLIEELIAPALEADPPDPATLPADENERMVALFAHAIQGMPLSRALEIAEAVEEVLDPHEAAVEEELLQPFLDQVPRGDLEIRRRTEDGAWATADGRPIHFERLDGHWYAIGVWFSSVQIDLTGSS